jgi:hypothetical protein
MGIPENRISLIIIESISIDSKAILLVVIVPGVIIIVSWFCENITGLLGNYDVGTSRLARLA